MTGLECPSQVLLEEYVSGAIAPTALDHVSTHLDQCPKCREHLERLSHGSGGVPRTLAETQNFEPEFAAAVSQILNLAADVPLTVGQRLHDYQLLEVLGEGGMGTVFKARHERLDKIVALKVIRPGASLGATALGRFEREMKAVGRLRHTNIVQATDAGEADGILYLVMEYVEGTNLARHVKLNGPLPPEQAFAVIRQAALGLQHAHDAGLIHRDIKPSNLMLAADGHVKVLDLGLAAIAESPEPAAVDADADTAPGSDLTSPHHLLGTKDYMAPEQKVNAHAVDARADVYGLGGTLWYLLTGQPPHQGPPPAAVPERVWKKLLAENPDARIGSAAEAAAALPAPRRSRRAGLAVVLVLAICGGAIALLLRDRGSAGTPPDKPDPSKAVAGKLNMTEDEARNFQQKWAGHLGRETIIDGVNGHRFAVIGPGVVPLGVACDVTISKPFDISTSETTYGQFETFVKDSGYKTTAETDGRGGNYLDFEAASGQKFKTGPQYTWRTPGHGAVDANHPVTQVTYADAIAYCDWLTKTTKQKHRLPTEAEWLWAYRAGNPADPSSRWARGSKDDPACPYWIRTTITGPIRPQPVARRPTNPWGLHDMIGNVFEFCADEYEDYPNEPKTDYCCRSSHHKFAVIHGACYYSVVVDLVNSRGSEATCREAVGFRVVREMDAPAEAAVAAAPKPRPPPGTLPLTAEAAETLQRDWANYLNTTTLVEDPIETNCILIPPGGPFAITAIDSATLTKPYYLGEKEVTFDQFQQFINRRKPPYKTSVELSGRGQLWFGDPNRPNRQRSSPDLNWNAPGYEQQPHFPVTYVSFEDATAYCEWLSEKTGHRYRLPTLAEWKWAARGGTTTRFYWGDDFDDGLPYEWLRPNAGMTPNPVGARKPNPWGLRDIYGNVMELTGERATEARRKPGHLVDPKNEPEGIYVYLCGGSYVATATAPDPTIGAEFHTVAGIRTGMSRVGFRVLREIP